MSALLGPNELIQNFYAYSFVLVLRKTFSHSIGFACKQMIYNNLSKFEAPRARRYYRSSITFSSILLLLISYQLVYLEYWSFLLSFFTTTKHYPSTIVMCLLSIFTHTYRCIQVGTMKALDLYRVDDVLLH